MLVICNIWDLNILSMHINQNMSFKPHLFYWSFVFRGRPFFRIQNNRLETALNWERWYHRLRSMRKTATTFSIKHFSPTELKPETNFFICSCWLMHVCRLSDCLCVIFFSLWPVHRCQSHHQYTVIRVFTSGHISESSAVYWCQSHHQYADIRGILVDRYQSHEQYTR